MHLVYSGNNLFKQFSKEQPTTSRQFLMVTTLQEKLLDSSSVPELKDVEIYWDAAAFIFDTETLVTGFLGIQSGELANLNGKNLIRKTCFRIYTGNSNSLKAKCDWMSKVEETLHVDTGIADIDCTDDEVIYLSGAAVYKCSHEAFPTVSVLPTPRAIVTNISCGFNHAVFLTDDNSVLTYGIGSRGQLGHGDLETQATARIVDSLCGVKILSVAAGGWHSMVLSDIGDLYAWGWNESGQLGINSDPVSLQGSDNTQNYATPKVCAEPSLVDFSLDSRVRQVALGSRHSAAIVDDDLYCWGNNEHGQLGLNSNVDKFARPQKVEVCGKPIRLWAGSWNTLLLLEGAIS